MWIMSYKLILCFLIKQDENNYKDIKNLDKNRPSVIIVIIGPRGATVVNAPKWKQCLGFWC